jgi:hypothetical protein
LDAPLDLADEADAWSPPVQNAEEPADRVGADSEEEEDEGVDTV